jgi:hypothetical protein
MSFQVCFLFFLKERKKLKNPNSRGNIPNETVLQRLGILSGDLLCRVSSHDDVVVVVDVVVEDNSIHKGKEGGSCQKVLAIKTRY